jgi:quinol monooxygenase YgiN
VRKLELIADEPLHRFAQHTALRARKGFREDLVARFLEAAVIQRDNPACELMLVSIGIEDPDLVYVTEIWSTLEDWQAATRSPEIEAWAETMAPLVADRPVSVELDVRGGKSLNLVN